MLRTTEVGSGMNVVEVGHGKDYRCYWERDGRRWTGDFKYYYTSEYGFKSFTYNFTDYEYDEDTNRYYYRRESINLRPEMDGAMVRERIGKSAYMEVYGQLLEYFGLNKEETETAETAEECETTEICPECEAEVEVKSDTLRAECLYVTENLCSAVFAGRHTQETVITILQQIRADSTVPDFQ